MQEAKRFSDEHGLEVMGVFREVGSARDEHAGSKRPEFNKASTAAIRGGQAIVVTTCDRFASGQEATLSQPSQSPPAPCFDPRLREGGEPFAIDGLDGQNFEDGAHDRRHPASQGYSVRGTTRVRRVR